MWLLLLKIIICFYVMVMYSLYSRPTDLSMCVFQHWGSVTSDQDPVLVFNVTTPWAVKGVTATDLRWGAGLILQLFLNVTAKDY